MPERVTRRRFLQLATMLGIASLGMGVLRDGVFALECKYHIRIAETPDKLSPLATAIILEGAVGDKILSRWGQERLSLLDRMLGVLPQEFYTATTFCMLGLNNDRKIGPTSLCICSPARGSLQSTILFTARSFGRDKIMHETAHNFLGHYDEVTKNGELRNPITAEALNIIGVEKIKNIKAYSRDLMEKFPGHVDYVLDRLGNIEATMFYDKLGYGSYPSEFLPVACEFYTKGENYFSCVYSDMLGQETTKDLYNYMKGHLFCGREY